MSRSTLRRALERKDGSATALVPLIWRHAFRLEQMASGSLPMAAEDIARALRNVPLLYEVDAVTVGVDGAHLATACWLAGQPSLSIDQAWAAVGRQPLEPLPDPKSVPATQPMGLLVEVGDRLRSALGEQAGIAFVLPDPVALATLLGVPDTVSWANRVLIEIIRAVGPTEPELVLFHGTEARVQPRLASMCRFFQAEAFHLAGSVPGATVLAGLELDDGLAPPDVPTWLVTTGTEIPEIADPACLGPALQRLRQKLDHCARRRSAELTCSNTTIWENS